MRKRGNPPTRQHRALKTLAQRGNESLFRPLPGHRACRQGALHAKRAGPTTFVIRDQSCCRRRRSPCCAEIVSSGSLPG